MTLSWTQKDPDEVVERAIDFTAALNGAVIVSHTLVAVSAAGTGLDSNSHTDTMIVAMMSAGIANQIAVFTGRVVTSAGETLEETVILPIIDSYAQAPSGYTIPSASQLVAAFPEFASVPSIDFWISRGARMVDETWTEGDYSFGIMLAACDLMARAGLGTSVAAKTAGLGEFSEIKSGQLSLTRTSGSASGSLTGSTPYGQQFIALAGRNRPRFGVAAGGGCGPVSGYAKDWPGPFPWPVW